jgi:type IV secretion system protein VirD4
MLMCFGTSIDAEKFCTEKNAIFLDMPEEDSHKYFILLLIVQQLYREIISVADEHGGRLSNRVMMFLDENGTIPKTESAEMMFSSSRSRCHRSNHSVLCASGEKVWTGGVKQYGHERFRQPRKK